MWQLPKAGLQAAQGGGDLWLAKKGFGMDDSFLSVFLLSQLVFELFDAPGCLDTKQTFGENSWVCCSSIASFHKS